jgi:HSP20 family protein
MTHWVSSRRVPKSVLEKEVAFNRENLLNTFDKLFDDAFKTQFPELYKGYGIEPFAKASFPKVNVISCEDKIEIQAEIAGFNKEDISVQIEDNVLSITGKNSTQSSDNVTYLIRELKRSSFSRSFKLSDELDIDKLHAFFNNGLLHIAIPRKVKVKTKENTVRTVPIE